MVNAFSKKDLLSMLLFSQSVLSYYRLVSLRKEKSGSRNMKPDALGTVIRNRCSIFDFCQTIEGPFVTNIEQFAFTLGLQ